MGKKNIDWKTQRDASRGRKSKAGGGIKSKAAQLYTPLIGTSVCPHFFIPSQDADTRRTNKNFRSGAKILWFFLLAALAKEGRLRTSGFLCSNVPLFFKINETLFYCYRTWRSGCSFRALYAQWFWRILAAHWNATKVWTRKRKNAKTHLRKVVGKRRGRHRRGKRSWFTHAARRFKRCEWSLIFVTLGLFPIQ